MNEQASMLKRLGSDQLDAAVELLSLAFYEYPVMRYVIGRHVPDYDSRLRQLVHFFVAARFWKHGMVFGHFVDEHTLAGVATVSLPGEGESPAELIKIRDALWRTLGDDARARYEAYGKAWEQMAPDGPHHHLNMIGVHPACAGRGVARSLLEAVHTLVAADPDSVGVTLTTEDEGNVSLYQHFGYRILDHIPVADDLETWGFFRENPRT